MATDPNRFTDEALKEVLRRAAWDATKGAEHLRRGHFFATPAEMAAIRARLEAILKNEPEV